VNELTLLDDASRGMSAQRTILDLAARNVAAAQAAVPGHPYQRLVATVSTAPSGDPFDDVPDGDESEGDADDAPLVSISRRPGTGDPLTELIAVLDAQRAYEADASIFDIGKRLAERTLDIDR
jgi:flagellar basal body rod protein FlgC